MLVTSWYLTLWYSLWKSPLIICFSLFLYYRKKAAVQSTKDNGPNSWDCLLYPSYWVLWRQLIDCFETMQKERIQDPYVFALYLQPLTMSPNYVIPLIPHGGGGGKTQFLRHKPTVFSPLPAWGLKPSFYFLQKNIYFHKCIRFLYSCSFLHCFKTVSRLIFWKEGNLVLSADCRPGTAKVEEESKGQREKTFSYFTAAQAIALKFLLWEMATRRQDFFMAYSCYYSNQSLRLTPSWCFFWDMPEACVSLILFFFNLMFTSFGG